MTVNSKALQIKAKHQVYTLLLGDKLSKLYGEGYDFSELREYQMGDDIRKINWIISAKLGKPYIKELQENRELSVAVAVFMDGSVYFGKDNAKQKKLCEVATVLGYATLQNSDLFRGLFYSSKKEFVTPPTKQFYHVEYFSQKLFEASLLETKIDYESSIKDLSTHLAKPSLLFVLADFLENIDLSVLSQKHEVIAVIVRSRAEESPEKLDEVLLKSPQDGQSVDTYFGASSKKKYLENLKRNDENLMEHFFSYNIRYVKIFVDDEVVERLMALFH